MITARIMLGLGGATTSKSPQFSVIHILHTGSYETLEGTESGQPTAINLNSERSSSLDCEYSYKSVNLKLESFLNNKLGTSHPSLSSAERKIRKLSFLFNYNYLVRDEIVVEILGRNCG